MLILELSLSKTLWTIEARLLWYPQYFGFFATLNAVSSNILSAIGLLGKFFLILYKLFQGLYKPYKPFHVGNRLYLVRFDLYLPSDLYLHVFISFKSDLYSFWFSFTELNAPSNS